LNIPSIKILERTGFLKEGHMRNQRLVQGKNVDEAYRGKYFDEVYYGMTLDDYRSRPDGQSPADSLSSSKFR
jgi:RimJ/RimL family protein N-acetyltransferase